MEISIIIVNYNLSEEVHECLKSILTNVKNIKYEVIVVDNCSPNRDSLKEVQQLVKDKFTKIEFYYLEENIGFGGANNFGYTKSVGDYICFLNPDTVVVEDIFTPAIEIFKLDSKVGIIGPKIINNKKKQEKSFGIFPNLFIELMNIFFLAPFYEKLFTKIKILAKNQQFVKVDWVTGSVLIIRRKLFETIHGFDTKFFMYSEEIDLCKRAHEIGAVTVFFKENKIIHLQSVSSKKDYYFFTKTSYESKLTYIKKHFNGHKLKLLKLIIFIQIVLQIVTWTMLFPFEKQKSIGKLRAFPYLLALYFQK